MKKININRNQKHLVFPVAYREKILMKRFRKFSFFYKCVTLILLLIILTLIYIGEFQIERNALYLIKVAFISLTIVNIASLISSLITRLNDKIKTQKAIADFSIRSLKEIRVLKYISTGIVELCDGDVCINIGKDYPYQSLTYDEAKNIIKEYKNE